MSEHRIRFRGGWEASPAGGDPGAIRRLTLPIAWGSATARPICLTRRFGHPSIDPAVESVRLELRDVPGLRSVQLNGNDLGPIPLDVDDWTIPLAGLLEARNTLTLEVVAPPAIDPPGDWGSIALVIARKP
jgi:hypothetical protein